MPECCITTSCQCCKPAAVCGDPRYLHSTLWCSLVSATHSSTHCPCSARTPSGDATAPPRLKLTSGFAEPLPTARSCSLTDVQAALVTPTAATTINSSQQCSTPPASRSEAMIWPSSALESSPNSRLQLASELLYSPAHHQSDGSNTVLAPVIVISWTLKAITADAIREPC